MNLLTPVAMGGGYFDPGLVILSYVIAVLASFTALSLSKRYVELKGDSAAHWLLGGSFSMGLGIWSMHFVGMLAFSMDMHFSYDTFLTLVSLAVGMLSAASAIFISSQKEVGWKHLLGGGSLLGCGIAGMHYTGMEAMVMPVTLSYDPLLFTLSILIAIVASIVALWIISRVNLQSGSVIKIKVGAALIMGFAICGMHYTGMAAAIYTPIEGVVHSMNDSGLSNRGLALAVATATLVVLIITLIMTYFERKLDFEKEVAERLSLVVKERTKDLEEQAKNLARANKQLEMEIKERHIAEEESTILSHILDESSSEIYYFDNALLQFIGANKGAQRNIQYTLDELKNMSLHDLMVDVTGDQFMEQAQSLRDRTQNTVIFEAKCQRKDQSIYLVKVNVQLSYVTNPPVFIAIVEDITELKKMEEQLMQSQKLESIGQLAAGVAHEINTPIQFINDNTKFIQQSFDEMNKVVSSYVKLLVQLKKGKLSNKNITDRENELEDADVEYITEEVPKAIEQSIEGLEHVANIVRAMKDFSHPGQVEKTLTSLNQVLETTVTVSSNEWRYVADIQLDLNPALPSVPCLQGEINQVFLNLIVNAAHAINDVVESKGGEKGVITLSTHIDDNWVEVRIKDTGKGIPENIRQRIFDPFYTTKEVGKGSGQGLAIAHSIIVENHQGQIYFESEMNKGTTFIIRLPYDKVENVPA